MNKKVIIGIDGGGTYTRVVVANLKGRILASSLKGGSHPLKNRNAKDNVQSAIIEAIKKAQVKFNDVQLLVAGLAGLNNEQDQSWAQALTDINGLGANRLHVNDGISAYTGAFYNQKGILALAGTGSIILGQTELGEYIRNYDFQYDPKAAARYFSYNALFEILTRHRSKFNSLFVQELLAFWKVSSINELSDNVMATVKNITPETIQKLSRMAPIVTANAEKGDDLAQHICDHIINSLAVGIHLIGSRFQDETILLAFAGGILRNEYIKNQLLNSLKEYNPIKSYVLIDPLFSPVIGSVILAYRELNIELDNEIYTHLKEADSKLVALY